ncbi:restriction endonuclease subunit S domain-containing protein [Lachnoclostridium phytofermentans]|uniref:Uncharacterized protein n=1 Tax=Lachnoclostridium phytofermentans (strain ATCC 700394 / DSM 18823 / ISDg) TaxID=357809 RepID=A9KT45_LACP7|nr:hypothetical protein [Lachnoclostridium phytofermentans]ABX42256.1 hypothetical protein Cphy_1887 [Lachnoclostridium phytofermentans ISDg]
MVIGMNLEKQVLEFLNNSLNWYLSTTPCLFQNDIDRININELAIFEVESILEVTDAERMRSIENILNSLPTNETNFFYIIHGSKGIIKFYYGIAPNFECRLDEECIRRNIDFSAEVLFTSLTGNLEDSTIIPINQEGITNLIEEIDCFRYNAMVEGTPGVLDATNLNLGIDRIETIMNDDDFVYLVIAHRFTLQEIACIIQQIEEIDNLLSIITDEIITRECVDSNSATSSNNLTNLASNTDTYTRTDQIQSGIPVIGENTGGEITGGEEIIEENNEVEEVVDTKNEVGEVSATDTIKLESNAKAKALQGAISNSLTNTSTKTKAETITIRDVFGNMSAREWRLYIQDVLFPRLNFALGSSLYRYSSVLKTNNKAVLKKLESIIQSIYSGSSGNNVPIKFTNIDQNECALDAFQNFQFLTYFKYQNCKCRKFSCEEIKARSVFSQVLNCDLAFGGNIVSSGELGIMVSLPNDLAKIDPSCEYRLTDCYEDGYLDAHNVLLGHYVKSGQIMMMQKIILTKKLLTHNIYLTGSYQDINDRLLYRILEESSYSYLIVNTWRNYQQKRVYESIPIYDGLGNETGIFPINLFQFYEGNQIQTQIDFLKLCFQSVIPLSDILLSIVEKGCYECYADYGWDIDTSTNSWFCEESFLDTVHAFPILSDLIEKVKVLIRNEITDSSIRDECNMELRTKLEVLLLGKKSSIFNVHQSANFMTILEQKSYLSLTSLYNSLEKEYYLVLLMQKLYQVSKKLKEREEEFHFLTAWNSLHELFPNQNILSNKRVEFFEHYIEQASDVGLSYYLYDSTPSKLSKDILKQIPTIISGRLTKIDDLDSIDSRIKLNKDQKKKIIELDPTRVLFSFNDDSMVYECESF